jgi:uncharacterized protein
MSDEDEHAGPSKFVIDRIAGLSHACGGTRSPSRERRRGWAARPADGGMDSIRARSSLRLVIPMELVGVRLEVPANNPVVMLREQAGLRRVLPIYIGSPEAAAIHYALEGIVPPRPLTHDLMRDVLNELGATLHRVVVTEIHDHTFFAELQLQSSGIAHTISSRPSDAIALAVRIGCPIFAEEAVLDEAGHAETEQQRDPEAEILAEFQNFIDQVSPDDFA